MAQEFTPEKYAIIVLGEMWTGKSSTLNLFTKRKPSGAEHKCVIATYVDARNPNVSWVETCGCRWGEADHSDINSLEVLFGELYKKGVKAVKVLWMVRPCTRKTQTLERQVRYVSSLGDGIWKSTVLVVKKGSYNDDQGALKACGQKIPTLKLTCVDWIPPEERRVQLAIFEKNDALRKHCGLLYEHEFREKVWDALASVQPTQIVVRSVDA